MLGRRKSSEEAQDKSGSWLTKKRQSLPTVVSAPKQKGGGKLPSPEWEKDYEGLPASVPWVMLSLSPNANPPPDNTCHKQQLHCLSHRPKWSWLPFEG